jgi:hypothetical protein
MPVTNSNLRCQGQTKAGKPCRAAATSGGLCSFHANPNIASELGRIGGRSKSRIPAEFPKLDKAIAVQDAVEKLVSEVYAGQLHPRVAAGLAPLLNLQLRALEATDLDRRLEKVESLLDKLKDQLTDARVEAKREAERKKQNDETLGKRPLQAVKPYGSIDVKVSDQS